MQRGTVELNVQDYVVLTQPMQGGRGSLLSTAQIVAANGDALTVVPDGSASVLNVKRSDVQAYQEVYGIPHPGAGEPVINLSR